MIDPYANAFNRRENGNGHVEDLDNRININPNQPQSRLFCSFRRAFA